MPLSLDDLLAQPANQGSFVGTSGTATLPTATGAASTVLIVCNNKSANGTVATPANFTRDSPAPTGTNVLQVFRRSNVPGGTTSWTLGGLTTAGMVNWVVYEVAPDKLDDAFPVDAVVSALTVSTSGFAASTGTAPESTTYDGLVVAAWGGYNSSIQQPTFSGHTNGLVEQNEVAQTSGSESLTLSVAMRTTQQLISYTSTATSATGLQVGNPAAGLILVYTAKNAHRSAQLELTHGFEAITTDGLANGPAGFAYVASTTGDVTVTATNHRPGGERCLRVAATAGIANVVSQSVSLAAFAVKAAVLRLPFRFEGSLPAADTEVHAVIPGTGTGTVTIRYRSATQKLGLQIGTGTEQLSDQTVTAGTWLAVDLRLVGTTTAYAVDWSVDYGDNVLVAQTPASFTASAALASYTLRSGWSANSTATVLYDDQVCSATAGHYPLDDYQIRMVKVDPAGTITINGNATNFNVFTNNATLAAFTSAAAIAALDEYPPTIGGSADGLTQIAATEYAEIPMETIDLAGVGIPRGVKMCAPGWTGAGTGTNNIGFRCWDGTTETVLFATATPGFDNTSSRWVCAQVRVVWDEAKLAGLAFRFGFTTDANPDPGIHAIYGEVAVQMAKSVPVFGGGAALRVAQLSDPQSGGIRALHAYTPAGQTATLTYEVNGTPTTVNVPAGSNPLIEVIDAPDMPTVNRIELIPGG